MRTSLLTAAGALAACAALAGTSIAQQPGETTIKVKPTVTPNKAGTKKKPRKVKLKVHVDWTTAGDGEKPVTKSADVLFPKGSLYNGGKYPKCSQSVLSRSGPTKCPKGSIMGKGKASAYADDVMTYPKITVVNGGKSKVFLYTVMNNPARVQAPVPGTIKKTSGKWAYKLHLTVPESLQIVAGVPIALKTFDVTAGGKNDWMATTSCTGGKWPFSVETQFREGGSAKFESTTPCKK